MEARRVLGAVCHMLADWGVGADSPLTPDLFVLAKQNRCPAPSTRAASTADEGDDESAGQQQPPALCPAVWVALRDLTLLCVADLQLPLPRELSLGTAGGAGGSRFVRHFLRLWGCPPSCASVCAASPPRRVLLALGWLVARCSLFSRSSEARRKAAAVAGTPRAALQAKWRPLPPDTSMAHAAAAASVAVAELSAHSRALHRLKAMSSQRTWGPVLQAEVSTLRREAAEVASLLDCYARQVHALTKACKHSVSEVLLMRDRPAVEDAIRRAAQARESEENWKHVESAFWNWMESVVELQSKEDATSPHPPTEPEEDGSAPAPMCSPNPFSWEALLELHNSAASMLGSDPIDEQARLSQAAGLLRQARINAQRWSVYCVPEEPPQEPYRAPNPLECYGRRAVPAKPAKPAEQQKSECVQEIVRLQGLIEAARGELNLVRKQRAELLQSLTADLESAGVITVTRKKTS